ncbi:hypothetical protein BJ165DRAFT_862775 [Panaeolus papilionaceus]|nr:hypothetical protein BJ165DRAFT_862775 [Panaeolus papilionaceus]
MSQPINQNPDRSQALWFDDATPSIEYSGAWDPIPWDGAFQSTIHQTRDVGASASFNFPGPAYAFINITWPACQGSGYQLRAYVHGFDDNVRPVSLNCGTRNDVDFVELYWNIIDKPGPQKMTVEFIDGGTGKVPLMLDSFGYLPMSTSSPTPTPPPTSPISNTPQTATSDASISPLSTVNNSKSGNQQPPFSMPVLVAISVALVVGFIAATTLFACRHKMRALCSRVRGQQPNKQDMEKKRTPTPLNPYGTLGASSPSQLGLIESQSTLDRPRSPNSLFDDVASNKSNSTMAIPSCILGQNPKFGQCFCPTCDETHSAPRQSGSFSTPSARPTSSGARSDTQSSITAIGLSASYRPSSAGSHTAASVYSNPFTDRHTSMDATLRDSTSARNPFEGD